MKVYCEHGALTKELRKLREQGLVKLVHFPYDRDGKSKRLEQAVPSEARHTDMANLTWDSVGNGSWQDFTASPHLDEIKCILGGGKDNRRDALHIDSAYKSGCKCFVTRDKGITKKRAELEPLLGMRFYDPDEGREKMLSFITGSQ